jgi:hypothetical protein
VEAGYQTVCPVPGLNAAETGPHVDSLAGCDARWPGPGSG